MKEIIMITSEGNCKPCDALKNRLASEISEGLVKVVCLSDIPNEGDFKDYAMIYNVISVPTVIFLDFSKEVNRLSGAQCNTAKQAIIEFLK
jgi:thioredoxin-related protein